MHHLWNVRETSLSLSVMIVAWRTWTIPFSTTSILSIFVCFVSAMIDPYAVWYVIEPITRAEFPKIAAFRFAVVPAEAMLLK